MGSTSQNRVVLGQTRMGSRSRSPERARLCWTSQGWAAQVRTGQGSAGQVKGGQYKSGQGRVVLD